MALIQLYTAAAPTVLSGAPTDAFSSLTHGFYIARYDCVLFWSYGPLSGLYKIFRDGKAIRISSVGAFAYNKGYDANTDQVMNYTFFPSFANYYDDPISMRWNPSKPAVLTYSGVVTPGNASGTAVVYGAAYYHPSGSATILKKNLTTGATIQTIVMVPSITPFLHDRMQICLDGTLVSVDFDNGTFGVVHFYDLKTNTNLYTSTIIRSKFAFIDTVNRNIWSIGLADSKMRIYAFQPAPSQFSPYTVGSNRKRYRSDEITTTLKGSNSEVIKNWPVQWELNQATPEGALESLYTVTDELGVTANRFYGPGAADYLGQSTEIKAWTAY